MFYKIYFESDTFISGTHFLFFMPYKQTTYETCLACCLLNASTKKVNKKLELECINHSMNYSKDDFVSGHTDFVEKKFNVSIN